MAPISSHGAMRLSLNGVNVARGAYEVQGQVFCFDFMQNERPDPKSILDSSAQQKAYRALFQAHDPQIADQIRQATNGNFVLGNARFVQQITEALGRRVTPAASGRPPKKKTPHP